MSVGSLQTLDVECLRRSVDDSAGGHDQGNRHEEASSRSARMPAAGSAPRQSKSSRRHEHLVRTSGHAPGLDVVQGHVRNPTSQFLEANRRQKRKRKGDGHHPKTAESEDDGDRDERDSAAAERNRAGDADKPGSALVCVGTKAPRARRALDGQANAMRRAARQREDQDATRVQTRRREPRAVGFDEKPAVRGLGIGRAADGHVLPPLLPPPPPLLEFAVVMYAPHRRGQNGPMIVASSARRAGFDGNAIVSSADAR